MDRLEDDVQAVLRLDETDVLDDIVVVEVLEKVDFCLERYPVSISALMPASSQFPSLGRVLFESGVDGSILTSIMRSSLLGKSVSLICLTATASPVPQLKAL